MCGNVLQLVFFVVPCSVIEVIIEETCGESVQVFKYLDIWIFGVISKQLRLLRGRVEESTILVNSLSPQMR